MQANPVEQIQKILNQAIKNLKLPNAQFSIDHPAIEAHGDYACNIALVLFPLLKKEGRGEEYPNPHSLAEAITTHLKLKIENLKFLDNVELAGPGFINFTLSPTFLMTQAKDLIENKWEKSLAGQKIAVEYTDPNPFKEFHIGHLYSNIIGESISRIYEANGATVWRADFYGDTGLHIAKSVWGVIQKMAKEKLTLDNLEHLPLKDRQNLLGQGYAVGVVQYDSDPKVKTEINKINLLIYKSKNDSSELAVKVYQAGLKWSLDYFESYYKRLGTKFDGYYPESMVGEIGLKLVEQGLKLKVLEVGDDGAVVYKGEKDGLHTRVFRNKLGLPTYEAKDLGLVQAKYQDFQFDKSINIFGKEIDEYFKVVKVVMEKIIPELGKKQFHLAHGMVNLPEGKMSSRSGNVITVEWLLNQSAALAFDLIHNPNLNDSKKREVAEKVGQSAIKYALLTSNIGDNVTFDFEKSVSFSGNSGPYLQYTHARCRSVLSKAPNDIKNLKFKIENLETEEIRLLRWFYRFPEVINQAATNLAPHLICTYLYELAGRYNTFYNKYSILSGDAVELRLLLTAATAQILKHGLYLLGIQAPDKM